MFGCDDNDRPSHQALRRGDERSYDRLVSRRSHRPLAWPAFSFVWVHQQQCAKVGDLRVRQPFGCLNRAVTFLVSLWHAGPLLACWSEGQESSFRPGWLIFRAYLDTPESPVVIVSSAVTTRCSRTSGLHRPQHFTEWAKLQALECLIFSARQGYCFREG